MHDQLSQPLLLVSHEQVPSRMSTISSPEKQKGVRNCQRPQQMEEEHESLRACQGQKVKKEGCLRQERRRIGRQVKMVILDIFSTKPDALEKYNYRKTKKREDRNDRTEPESCHSTAL